MKFNAIVVNMNIEAFILYIALLILKTNYLSSLKGLNSFNSCQKSFYLS